MRRTNTLQVIVILFLTISCADRNLEEQEKEASHPQAIEIQGSEQPKLSPAGGETKNYVPGEILVKFRNLQRKVSRSVYETTKTFSIQSRTISEPLTEARQGEG
jgi:hypothetical protein